MQPSRPIAIDQPSSLSPAKPHLNRIIQLTEEQEPSPVIEPPQNVQVQPMPQQGWAQLRSYFKCCCNLWGLLRRSPERLQLDVSDGDFATVISRIKSKKSYYAAVLPVQKQIRKVLVLDLDETLIHTSFTKPVKHDYQSEVIFNGKSTKIYTIKRFGLQAFLFEMSRLYELVVFTASQRLYADKVLDLIDPKRRISHRLYREHCIVINKTYYLKNLKILGRDLSQVVIVDDNNIAGLLHPDNFYRIEQFDGNDKDRQLCRLSAFLKHIHQTPSLLPEMEINLEEAILDPVTLDGRSLNARKRQYRHKKTNSEVETLFEKNQADAEAETTASQLMKQL